ncbi:hypothetical protein [Falsiroseomonas sp. HW251]|uniref:hypothetical protein n=1 Tax=Falsiroseomonas sp. HW251 TaxID=3390998 RepID=UPI003D31F90C
MIAVIEVWTTLALLNANLFAQASRAALGLAWAGAARPGGAGQWHDPDLSVLGLGCMPASKQELRRAYRRAARTAHPDTVGGSQEAFLAVVAAFERLSAAPAGRWLGRP